MMKPDCRLVSRHCWGCLKRRARIHCRLQRIAAVFFFTSSIPISLAAQAPADKPANGDAAPVSRPCAASSSNPAPKAKTKGKAAAISNQTASACLEAKGAPLEIQEFFQSYVREQAWRIGEEKIVADGWMFARYLDKNELLQFAKEGLLADRVRWTEGRAYIQVNTRELDGGFARVEVSARFQGYGQSVDRFAPPKDTWDLDSNSTLEKALIAALDTHLKSLH